MHTIFMNPFPGFVAKKPSDLDGRYIYIYIFVAHVVGTLERGVWGLRGVR